jgi:hypothetical protein
MRLSLVTAFCLGGFSFENKRFFKPLNPLLGETYEYIDDSLKFRFFAEQVSIDPPTSAVYVEGEGYRFNSNLTIISKHQIKKDLIEISTSGISEIYFPNFNEIISFTKPKIIIKNFCNIEKKLQIQISGKFLVFNNKTREICEIQMNEENEEMNNNGSFSGVIRNDNNDTEKIIAKIQGNVWSHFNIFVKNGNLWETICTYKNFNNDDSEKYYFNKFISNLNHLNEELSKVLPPTDSRFRKDSRALESQNYEKALNEQEKMEENQKIIFKSYVNRKLVYEPKYFMKYYDEENGEIRYIYTRDYWLDRMNKNFENFPKLFS